MPAMKTRRQGKATDSDVPAAAAEDTVLDIELTEDIDRDVLNDIIPDVSLEAPSAESVLAVYRLLLSQASELDSVQQELDSARAELDRKDVELEQVHQDGETAVKELEAAKESAQNEAMVVKAERDQLGTPLTPSCSHLSTEVLTCA